MKVYGHLVDIHKRNIYKAGIDIVNGRILSIKKSSSAPEVYIMPGLIDSHIHIESTMITPGAFALTAVRHGTTGVVSDPHEIANVLGMKGIDYMVKEAGKVPLRFWFGAPSCVPATVFETNGAELNSKEIRCLMELHHIKYLSEMMNYPGVISGERLILEKIRIARSNGKPVDGHAPGLTGEMLKKYVFAGISTDHECSTIEEAKEKISLGMKILIREGSAAKNLNSLKSLFDTNPAMVMLCSDDLHPEMLRRGHINKLIGSLVKEGFNEFDVIRSATRNPVEHYNLEAGLLQNGQSADFIVVDSLENMNVLETWIKGEKIFGDNKVLFSYEESESVNNFHCLPISEDDIRIVNQHSRMRVIKASEGELKTKEVHVNSGRGKLVDSDTDNDVLKIVVKERYHNSPPAAGFIKGFGLKGGAFASSVSHDSHNIIAVGTNDRDITIAVNEIVNHKGGLAVSSCEKVISLPLNIGGIMTTQSCEEVADEYNTLNKMVNSLGCTMTAPFMTLSFMALLVIPDLKIGDRGLFDVRKFENVSLFLD